jgi:hypothetical protein
MNQKQIKVITITDKDHNDLRIICCGEKVLAISNSASPYIYKTKKPLKQLLKAIK